MKKGPLNATLDNGGVNIFPNDHAMGDVILHDGANNFVPGVIDARSMTFDNVRIIFIQTHLISPVSQKQVCHKLADKMSELLVWIFVFK